MQGPSPIHMEVQCRVHLQFTWRSSAGSISSSHGGPVQGPSPVHMGVQCSVHLQFTWRSSAGSISSSHGGPVQGPSPVHMEVQCSVHLQFTWRSTSSFKPGTLMMEPWLAAAQFVLYLIEEMDPALDLHLNWRWWRWTLHWTSM